MSKKYITKNLELFDVITAFPNLKESLIAQNIVDFKIIEGQTIEEFLVEKNYSQNEIDKFIQRINTDLNIFLYKEDLKLIPTKPEEEYIEEIILDNLDESENSIEEE